MQDRQLGGHALWGTGAGAVLGCCSVEVLVQGAWGRVRRWRVCCVGGWGCCFGVLVTVRAHMDGRVLGRVLFGVSWLSHHHDAGRSIMMLASPIRTLLLARTVVCNGSWLVCHHDVVNHVMMLLQLLRCCIMVRGCGGGRMLSTSG